MGELPQDLGPQDFYQKVIPQDRHVERVADIEAKLEDWEILLNPAHSEDVYPTFQSAMKIWDVKGMRHASLDLSRVTQTDAYKNNTMQYLPGYEGSMDMPARRLLINIIMQELKTEQGVVLGFREMADMGMEGFQDKLQSAAARFNQELLFIRMFIKDHKEELEHTANEVDIATIKEMSIPTP